MISECDEMDFFLNGVTFPTLIFLICSIAEDFKKGQP